MTSGQETDDDDDDVVTLLDNQTNDETGLYVVDWDPREGMPSRYEVRFSFSGETWYDEHADAVTACREYAAVVADPFVARARAETEAAIVRRLAGELGEFEVGPVETLEDVDRYIRDLGKVLYRFIVRDDAATERKRLAKALQASAESGTPLGEPAFLLSKKLARDIAGWITSRKDPNDGTIVAGPLVTRARAETTAAIVRRLAGELGEFEIGPTETIDDVVRHVQGLGDAVSKLVGANADRRKALDTIRRLTAERDDAVAHVAKRRRMDRDRGDGWCWAGDGTDDLDSMSDVAVIQIEAADLRSLLADAEKRGKSSAGDTEHEEPDDAI